MMIGKDFFLSTGSVRIKFCLKNFGSFLGKMLKKKKKKQSPKVKKRKFKLQGKLLSISPVSINISLWLACPISSCFPKYVVNANEGKRERKLDPLGCVLMYSAASSFRLDESLLPAPEVNK